MDEATTMTVPPPLPVKTQARDTSQAARQTVSIRTPSASAPLAAGPGATVFVGVSAPTADSATTCRRRVPEVRSATNGHEERSSSVVESSSRQQRWQQNHHQQQQQQAAHIVKIKINPDGDKNGRVISTVRLTLDENGIARERTASRRGGDGAVVVSATNLVNERQHCESAGEGCVTISVFGGEPTSGNRNGASIIYNNSNNSSISSDKSNDEDDDDDDGGGGGDDDDDDDGSSNVRSGQSNDDSRSDSKDMVHRETTETLNSSSLGGRPNACFYYNSYQSPLNGMVMSSGQCSPSDTLDSGTCSDLDGTPPPLPKKKNASTVILSSGTHNRTGSLTSSGAEVDSDDNESNISCDSLNGAEEYRMHSKDHLGVTKEAAVDAAEKSGVPNEDDRRVEKPSGVRQQLVTEPCSPVSSASVSPSPSGTSSLSKASSTPRVRSPEPAIEILNGAKPPSPVVKERTYEERKQERTGQECAEAERDQPTGHKYLYEDDRYYNFHVNELRGTNGEQQHGVAENEECFAGYKIHDKEAIRSAKGTVRGVKNRVRAGIATFLQTPSSKAYVEREKGRVVLYTTSLGIVRETFTNCMKMKQMLWTNMVKYEEADLFRDTELQTELRDRTDSEVVTLPQLFVDGQYIGGVDTVERLNESGELRRILEPYQCKDACVVCTYCGGFQRLLCPVCHGSKRSVHRNEFTVEFVALKCAKCDVFGMIRCPHC